MADRVAVRLLQGYGSLNAGEVAGFPASEAERLIQAGRAARLEPIGDPIEPVGAESVEEAEAEEVAKEARRGWRRHRAILSAPVAKE
jgi:hypothetical protein